MIGNEFKVSRQIVKHYMRGTMNNPKEDLFLKDPTWSNKESQAKGPKTKCWVRRQSNEGNEFKIFKHINLNFATIYCSFILF